MLRTFLIIGAASIVLAACTASSGTGGSDGPQPTTGSPGASAGPAGTGGSSLPAAIIDPINTMLSPISDGPVAKPS